MATLAPITSITGGLGGKLLGAKVLQWWLTPLWSSVNVKKRHESFNHYGWPLQKLNVENSCVYVVCLQWLTKTMIDWFCSFITNSHFLQVFFSPFFLTVFWTTMGALRGETRDEIVCSYKAVSSCFPFWQPLNLTHWCIFTCNCNFLVIYIIIVLLAQNPNWVELWHYAIESFSKRGEGWQHTTTAPCNLEYELICYRAIVVAMIRTLKHTLELKLKQFFLKIVVKYCFTTAAIVSTVCYKTVDMIASAGKKEVVCIDGNWFFCSSVIVCEGLYLYPVSY